MDIDYVNQVVWPTITLADFFDVPHRIKDRKLDPYTVFEDAGVKLIYDPRESDKVNLSIIANSSLELSLCFLSCASKNSRELGLCHCT